MQTTSYCCLNLLVLLQDLRTLLYSRYIDFSLLLPASLFAMTLLYCIPIYMANSKVKFFNLWIMHHIQFAKQFTFFHSKFHIPSNRHHHSLWYFIRPSLKFSLFSRCLIISVCNFSSSCSQISRECFENWSEKNYQLMEHP